MKVQKTTQEPKFAPVELRITIETAEEYSVFRNLVWHSASIPAVVFEDEPEKQIALSRIMSSILVCL